MKIYVFLIIGTKHATRTRFFGWYKYVKMGKKKHTSDSLKVFLLEFFQNGVLILNTAFC
jgi:hypothetical protein